MVDGRQLVQELQCCLQTKCINQLRLHNEERLFEQGKQFLDEHCIAPQPSTLVSTLLAIPTAVEMMKILKGAFYIYLDTSPLLVSSGSEDCVARVWDR